MCKENTNHIFGYKLLFWIEKFTKKNIFRSLGGIWWQGEDYGGYGSDTATANVGTKAVLPHAAGVPNQRKPPKCSASLLALEGAGRSGGRYCRSADDGRAYGGPQRAG